MRHRALSIDKEALLERFLRYVALDTSSDPDSEDFPSTERQLQLSRLLLEEIKAMGIEDAQIDEHGYLIAKLPASVGYEALPKLAFIAHVDTSPDFSGSGVRPQVIDSYQGGDIALGSGGLVLSPKEFPLMKQWQGHTVVTTDGTTLLGSDDKAGLAIIMAFLEQLLRDPELKHGSVRVCFTPDEEIGRGMDFINMDLLDADYAFTLDGSTLGELEYECFNASSCKVEILGKSIHPGYAYQKMLNALELWHEFHALLPRQERPELTQGREGFLHLHTLEGGVERLEARYILRDFDASRLAEREQAFFRAGEILKKRYPETSLRIDIAESYRNMYEVISQYPELLELARESMKALGITPLEHPIRGGTDGARLSFLGVPCPNLFTGGMNFHGPYECCSIDEMRLSSELLLEILRQSAEQPLPPAHEARDKRRTR